MTFDIIKNARNSLLQQQQTEYKELDRLQIRVSNTEDEIREIERTLAQKTTQLADVLSQQMALDEEIRYCKSEMGNLEGSLKTERARIQSLIVTAYDRHEKMAADFQDQPDTVLDEAETELMLIQAEYNRKTSDINNRHQKATEEMFLSQSTINTLNVSIRNLNTQLKILKNSSIALSPIMSKLQSNQKELEVQNNQQAELLARQKKEEKVRESSNSDRVEKTKIYRENIHHKRNEALASPTPEELDASRQFNDVRIVILETKSKISLATDPEVQAAAAAPIISRLQDLEKSVREEVEKKEKKEVRLEGYSQDIQEQKRKIASVADALALNEQGLEPALRNVFTDQSTTTTPLMRDLVFTPEQDPVFFRESLKAASGTGVDFSVSIEGNLDDKNTRVLAAALADPYLQIKKLNIRKTGLTEVGFEKLFSALSGNFGKLQVLNISDNDLGKAGAVALGAYLSAPGVALEDFDCSSMGVFDADMCHAVGMGLCTNTSIINFTFSYNQASRPDVFSGLFTIASQNPSLPLRKVTLNFTPCLQEAKTVEAIVQFIGKSTQLAKLSLIGTGCNDVTAPLFFNRLTKLPAVSMQDLDVRDNQYKNALSGNALLRFITADRIATFNFDISPIWGGRLPNVLSNTKMLSSIFVQATYSDQLERDDLVKVVDILEIIGSRDITIATYGLDFGGRDSLPSVRTYFETHRAFNFSGAFKNPSELDAFFSYLPYNPNIVFSLDLSDSNLTDADVDRLAKFLPRFSRLQTLNLSNNKIKRRGCGSLLTATEYLPELEYICAHRDSSLSSQDANLLLQSSLPRLWLFASWEVSELFYVYGVTYDDFTRQIKSFNLAPRKIATQLNWSYKDLTIPSLERLIMGRDISIAVKEVNLSQNPRLGNDCLRVLPDFIKRTSLESLDLTTVGIDLSSSTDTKMFAVFLLAVADCTSLVTVEMADNYLGDEAVNNLLMALTDKPGFLAKFGFTGPAQPGIRNTRSFS